MKTGIILESAVPVRFEPSDRAEMVNQMLFGETYSVISSEGNWVEIKGHHDNYEGWIDLKQHSESELEAEVKRFCNAPTQIKHKTKGVFQIMPGSLMPSKEELDKLGYESSVPNTRIGGKVRSLCALFENAPYLWGGRTSYGIDCSGLTQLVYRMMEINLPRDASQQIELGDQVSFIAESLEGDLAFFDNAEGKITHVGIIIGENEKTIIHASGRVREDKIDHQGIYNEETKSYSHKLRTIKRIL